MQSHDTPAPPMDGLIARLEAAHIGSRVLDEAIATLIWGPAKPSGNTGGPRTLVWWDRGLGRSVAPEFTTSMDAAMTLVPDGWHVMMLNQQADGLWFCAMHSNALAEQVHSQEAFTRFNKPVAIAVCITALKARQASPPT